MESEHWHRIKKIFKDALERAPEERNTFLDEACRDEPALRGEVEGLLRADSKAQEFLETPPAPEDDLDDNGETLTGTRIGSYLLERVISSGGMGTVYEALQEQPRRTVAVKIMRTGIATRSALRRFEYEAEILARLRHPNIAHVIEAGTHRAKDAAGGETAGSMPYFVMEYIPGARAVTDYARAG